MKILSIKQPWAWLIVNGFKDIENRTWNSNFRGRFLIHAGQKVDVDGFDYINNFYELRNVVFPSMKNLEKGGIVGSVEMTDCITQSESVWFAGPYGFVLRNPQRMKFFKCSGSLGFFDLKFKGV